MSGIAVLAHLDGRPVEAVALQAMAAQMETRGPEASSTWRHGATGFAYTRLTTTPEAVDERQPLYDPGAGHAIVADVRLDNRADLIRSLGLAERVQDRLGDTELILRAYQRWGRSCPGRLLGDFAFALWDASRHELFCARDHFGVKPVYYHHNRGRLVAMASTPRALLALDAVPSHLDEGRIADVVLQLEGIDYTSTFFRSIHRLPPAHTLTVTSSGSRIERYWSLEPPTEVHLASDGEYDEALREQLTEAVRCRLRCAGAAGSMLSGGMDSGSIVALARTLSNEASSGPFKTFSAVSASPRDRVEVQAIRAAMTMDGLASYTVSPDTWHLLRPDLDELCWHLEEPFDEHMTLVRAVYMTARNQAMAVVLDGVGGDLILSEGQQLSDLLRGGHLLRAHREAAGLASFSGEPYTTPRLIYGALRQALPTSPAPLRRARRAVRMRRLLRSSALAPSFARRIGALDRLDQFEGWSMLPPADLRNWRIGHALTHPHLAAALERYDRVASSAGIEPRHPFLDLRLVEFCLSLPGSQRLSGGWPKAVLRRAMAGRLPDDVRWRRGKEHVGWTFTSELLGGDVKQLKAIVEDHHGLLAPYINMDRAKQALDNSADLFGALSLAQLGIWLEDHTSATL